MKDKIDSVQETLKDRYKLLGVLGEGGMSIVYKAQDLRLNSLVAIKVLHRDPEGLGAVRLQREAQTSSRLSSINIARVFNFGQTGGSNTITYMVMELLEGIGLDKLIKERGHLLSNEAVSIFKQICNGLCVAHAQNIVHRDLKPSNIVLLQTKEGWLVKILDFGIAQIETDQKLTKTGVLLGSPCYMSPEQIDGLELDQRSDIYSLGCLMFEVLTGETPFAGETSLETLTLHKNADPSRALDTIAEIPPPLVELVKKCLQKNPELRPQTVSEILIILEQVDNTDIATLPSIQSSQKPIQKSFSLWFICVPVLILACLVCSYFAFQIVETQNNQNFKDRNEPGEISYKQNKLPAQLGSKDSKFQVLGDQFLGQQVSGGEDVEDNDFKSLSLERVDSLRIHSRRLDGSGLKYLKNQRIKLLDLKNTNITSDNLIYLADLPVLTDLILHSPHIDDRALEEISRVKSLVNLNLDAGAFTSKGFEALTKLPNLSSITLINLNVTDQDLEPLSRIKSLTVVRIIDCTKVGPDIGIAIAKLPKIDTVFINNPMSKASYKAFARTHLRAFNLKNRRITPAEFDDICSVKTLWRIGFIQALVTDDNYKDLLSLPNLGRFEISRTEQISDSLISTLAQSHVQALDISFSGLRQDQLEKLISNSHLERIFCTGLTKISDEQLLSFRKHFQTKHHKPLQLIKGAM